MEGGGRGCNRGGFTACLGSFVFIWQSEGCERLHELILPVGVPVLVAGRGHVLLCEDVVVGMVLLPLLLLALLGDAGLLLFLRQASRQNQLAV